MVAFCQRKLLLSFSGFGGIFSYGSTQNHAYLFHTALNTILISSPARIQICKSDQNKKKFHFSSSSTRLGSLMSQEKNGVTDGLSQFDGFIYKHLEGG